MGWITSPANDQSHAELMGGAQKDSDLEWMQQGKQTHTMQNESWISDKTQQPNKTNFRPYQNTLQEQILTLHQMLFVLFWPIFWFPVRSPFTLSWT